MTAASPKPEAIADEACGFGRYSAFYDLLYADKDYTAEADYVAATLRGADPAVRRILELGCGTGRHGRLLAARGFEVEGVERSAEMAALAQAGARTLAGGSFACRVGDLRDFRAGARFDAVISLFHVISYQTEDEDLRAAFATAAAHLRDGGLFLFDVWHGPAVLAQPPAVRTKAVADAQWRVRRTATPVIDAERNTVTVTYHMACEDLASGERHCFEEAHRLRYLFADEVRALAADAGLQTLRSEEFLTGGAPSPDTWGVAYLMRKSAP